MKVLLLGGGGQIGTALRRLPMRDVLLFAPSRRQVDLASADDVSAAIGRLRPDAVVNAAAYTAVDRAEDECAHAFAVNRDGPAALAQACARFAIPLVHLSTDYVFDGRKTGPYRESDPCAPLNVYGRSKLEGEDAVRAHHPQHVILRTSWIYSETGQNFVRTILKRARRGEVLRIVADQRGCPTAASDVATTVAALVELVGARGELPWGTYHCASADAVTWYEFGRAILELAGPRLPAMPEVHPVASADYGARARRPENSELDCSRLQGTFGFRLPSWRKSLAALMATSGEALLGAETVS